MCRNCAMCRLPRCAARPVPTDAAREAVTRVWTMGWPFWAKRRLAGHRLVATDVDWRAGTGPQEVSGPIDALLLLLTGRTAALHRLSGPGVATLADRHRA